MAVSNYICENCQCLTVCAVRKKLVIFSEEATNQLGVDIEIQNCESFKMIKTEE